MKKSIFVFKAIAAIIMAMAVISAFLPQAQAISRYDYELDLLSRTLCLYLGDAEYAVQVAFCAMLINRTLSDAHPNSLPGAVLELMSAEQDKLSELAGAKPSGRNTRAADTALRGSDPSRGALYFSKADEAPEEIIKTERITFSHGGISFWK